MGAQLRAIALDELAVQPDCDNPVCPTDGQRAVAGNFAVAQRASRLDGGDKAGGPGGCAVFFHAAQSVAIDADKLRHARFVRKFCRAANPFERIGGYCHRADRHDGVAGRGAAVSRNATGSLAAQQGVYFARAAIQGIFFRRGGGLVAGGGAHWFYRGVLYVWQQSGSLGAAGCELFGCGEHFFSVDRGSRDWIAGVDQRRISLPLVRHTFHRAFDQIARLGNYSAGIFVELPA